MDNKQILIFEMIKLYCKYKHINKTLCKECYELYLYTQKKLNLCPFREKKPRCKKCKIHCYESKERLMIKKVMKFSGPKILFVKPYLTLCYFKQILTNR